MRRIYIWQQPDWPSFRWDTALLLAPLGEVRRKQGAFAEAIGRLGFVERREAELEALTTEAADTSKIEGEALDYSSVRSSVARRLGITEAAVLPEDARVSGIVEMTLDATQHYREPLTEPRLFRWHTGLFPIAHGKRPTIRIGAWRTDATGPMRIVSGRVDVPKVHYEAPPAVRVPGEMSQFIDWFSEETRGDGILRSAVAHLWFVTIHPFDDGNGRTARAVADMALAQDDESSQRFFSISRQILKERPKYYEVLERTQTGSLDITEWLLWYLDCYARAIEEARSVLTDVLHAGRFWMAHAQITFSERQRKVLNRFLHEFEGSLTARKWAGIAHTSTDTAARDISDLVSKGVLVRNPGGSKRTSYQFAPFD